MWFTLLALVGGSVVSAAAGDGWMAGVARVDITPEDPLWLAGYASRDREAEGTLHPIWLKALALRDAHGHRAVLVTSDVLGWPKPSADRVRARLRERLGLEHAQVILSASHTHSGPVLDGTLLCIYPLEAPQLDAVRRYTAALEDRAVAVAEQAFAALQPAQLESAAGVARFAVNRRNNREAEILRTHDFEGPVDHAAPVLRVTGSDGAPLAVVFGYACHNTTLDSYQWCGDYAGFAQIELENAFPGCSAMFFAGCGGDQNPLPRRSVARARQYGETLASAVRCALTGGATPLEPVLRTAYREIDLPLNGPPSREELEQVAATAQGYMSRAAREQLDILDAGGALRTSYAYPVQMWRIGGQALAVLGGEVVVDYAVAIKQMLGNETFVMAYANDVMSYIPSERVLAEGGYEGDTSQLIYGMPAKWRVGIEARILDAVRAVARETGVPETDAAP